MSCKDCMNRTVGCHSTCDSYKSWKDELSEKKEWLRKKNRILTGRKTSLKRIKFYGDSTSKSRYGLYNY